MRFYQLGTEPSRSAVSGSCQNQDPEVGHSNMWAEKSTGRLEGLGRQQQGDVSLQGGPPPAVLGSSPEGGLPGGRICQSGLTLTL